MQRFPEKRVAITGAASGLGLALAKYFIQQGWRVAFADIQDEEGERQVAALSLPQERAFYQHVDVTSEADMDAWLQAIVKIWGGLDILINNAGVATHGAIDQAPIEDWNWVLDINLLGVVRGCKAFAPLFKQQRSGQIINIASMAGLLHSPEMGSYNASKAGVVALSETLYGELNHLGIGVSVVCPGFFPTALATTARVTHPQVKESIERLFATSRISADDIAKIIFNAASDNDFYVLPHFTYRTTWWLKRFLPQLYLRSIRGIGKQMLSRRKKWEAELMTAEQSAANDAEQSNPNKASGDFA